MAHLMELPSETKAKRIVREIESLLTTPHRNLGDGLIGILEESNSLVMVTDLMDLRMRTSEKKRARSERESQYKSKSIRDLLNQLDQNQSLLSHTIDRCKDLERERNGLLEEVKNLKVQNIDLNLAGIERIALKRENQELLGQLQTLKEKSTRKWKSCQEEILQLKLKRKLEKNQWKILYQDLLKEVRRLKSQMAVDESMLY